MSEIQIVGPSGSGATRFTKFFDDDIVIEPNSKIYLNHAVLNKLEGVTFKTDQTFTLSITQAIVYGDLMDEPVLSFTIPEGEYSYDKLRTTLVDGINGIITNASNFGTFLGYNVLDHLSKEDDISYTGFRPSTVATISDDVRFGILPISINVSHNATTETIYQNTASTADVSSFAMMPSPYFHTSVFTDKSITEPIVQDAIINFELVRTNGTTSLSIRNIADSTALNAPKICMGLYGEEYSADDTVGTGTRTSQAGGITLVDDENGEKFPTMFFQAVIERRDEGTGDSAYLSVYVCRSNDEGSIKNWDTQQEEINTVKLIHKVDLLAIEGLDIDLPLRVTISTHQDTNDVDYTTEFKTYFTVNIQGQTLFDSASVRHYARLGFFTGLGQGTAVIRRSQRPFFPCIATNSQGYGADISYQAIPDDDSVAVRSMRFACTSELGKVLGIFSPANFRPDSGYYLSSPIYPNPANSEQVNKITAIPTNFEDFYRMASYVIKINNLPIQSFKTNEVKDNRGYKQSILATIPTPFQNSTVESRVNIDGQDYISVTYNAYYPLVKNMLNQRLVVNHFDVEVVRLTDDTEATDLDQIALNFTIQGPM